jgi:hypothetical protein
MILPTTAEATGGVCMPCKKGIRQNIEAAKEDRKKAKPALLTDKTGDVTAVSIGDGEFCYLRTYQFGHGVLPFLSRSIQRDPAQFPSLTPAFFMHVWVYRNDPTPMTHITNIPFASDEESWGPPMYYPPDPMQPCYKIHGIFNGAFSIIKPVSEADVRGLEEFRRYQPPELRDLLFSRRAVWDYIPAS